MDVAVTALIHPLDVPNHLHSVVSAIVQAPNKWRNVNRLFASFGCGVHGGSLGLRKAKGHVHAHVSLDGHFRRPKALAYAWIFDVGIRNPSEHLLALGQHLLRSSVEISKNFN